MHDFNPGLRRIAGNVPDRGPRARALNNGGVETMDVLSSILFGRIARGATESLLTMRGFGSPPALVRNKGKPPTDATDKHSVKRKQDLSRVEQQ